MKKMLFLSAACLLFNSAFAGQADAADGRYVRKQPELKTDFFVPANAINNSPEKLPPFYSEPTPQNEVHQATIMEVTTTDDEPEKIAPEQEKLPQENIPPKAKELPELLNENADRNLSEGPSYKQEYAAYQRDLAAIAQTGEAPKNPALEEDLAKMNSEERIPVSPEGTLNASEVQRLNPMAYAAAATGNANVKILDAVETVRKNPFETEEDDTAEITTSGEIPAVNPVSETIAQDEAAPMDEKTAAYFQGMNPFREDTGELTAKPDLPENQPEPVKQEELAEEKHEPEVQQQEPEPKRGPSLSLKRHSRSPHPNVIR